MRVHRSAIHGNANHGSATSRHNGHRDDLEQRTAERLFSIGDTNGLAESHEEPDEDLTLAEAGSSLPIEDLTALARTGRIDPAVVSGAMPLERVARVLCRRSWFHVLLVGDRGVGKTTLVRELARQAAAGERRLLGDLRFLRIDGAHIPPEESRAALEAIASSLLRESARHGVGGPSLVVCLDGVAALLRRPGGGTNVAEFAAALHHSAVPVIGVLSRWEYNDLLASHANVRELCTRIDVDEPSDETTREIVRQHVPHLSEEFRFDIPEPVWTRAVSLASGFLLSARQPAKTLRVLRLACEEAAYDRAVEESESASVHGEAGRDPKAPRTVDGTTVAGVVAAMSGVPVETISGESADVDPGAALRSIVVGQEEAVAAVADELRLIQAGLSDPGKPASVLLFAGLTGVGKTELAKAIAGLYSGSKRLNVYAMGNFTEPHSVSGILGVPPGYVGHDQGGRLINELHADPYSVFLLDEAEKAHPNVWKPFLNLFDEGWIEDPRGVRAWGDRSIFILTTNAGSDQIAQMTQNGASEPEIEERVKQALARVKHERSAQPVFTPQFLARMKRVLVFRPLDEAAMTGIATKLTDQVRANWNKKRGLDLRVDPALTQWIGRRAHALNRKSGDKEGGRILRRLISEWIETPAQAALVRRGASGRSARAVVVEMPAAWGDAADETRAHDPLFDNSVDGSQTPTIVVRLE